MSHLAFHSRTATVRLPGQQARQVLELAALSLETCLRQSRHTRVRYELGLPDVDSPFFAPQIQWQIGLGEPHHACGHDFYLIDLALQVTYEQALAAGVLCWLYFNAGSHGWVAGPDRTAMAAELQAAVDGALPASGRHHWSPVITFLRGDDVDAVTTLSHSHDFPCWQQAIAAGTWQPPVQDTPDPRDKLASLWNQVGAAQRWDLALAALQAQPQLRWHPGSYQFSRLTLDPAPSGPGGLIPASTQLAAAQAGTARPCHRRPATTG